MERRLIDADSHVLEPISLWKEYLEPEYRSRAMEWKLDERGLEYLEVDGKPAKQFMIRNGWLASPKTPGATRFEKRVQSTLGVADAEGRLQILDRDGVDATLLYPTLGIQWEPEVEDYQLSAAYARAYNNWVVDLCKLAPTRLYPVAHIVVSDVSEGVKELERTAKLGVKGAVISGRPINGKPYGDHYYDPFWTKAQELDIPVALHVMGYPQHLGFDLYPDTSPKVAWWGFVTLGLEVVLGLTTLFQGGVFDRFPKLKIVVLESGVGWLPYWLERMDEYQELYGYSTEMKNLPSTYFQRHCWICFEPGEPMMVENIHYIGADKFIWAGDYPHTDQVHDPVKILKEQLKPLLEDQRWLIYGENVARLYKL